MAIFKCKMCGGDLEVTDTKSVIECDYCGTSQTIPAADDEKKVNLFNRANKLRLKNDFDKAEGLYESIVTEFPKEAEAYWGICLCKYGIEYVDDPATGAKIPTCHRTSFKSIFDDENYALALENADVIAKKVYEDEAKAIDVLQKDILEVVNTVEPYDVFICYKETGADGGRTHDSVLAQDIYEELTAKGLKVFFSRITLEDKLGTAYEPYIFAALNSAKVMLSIGTKPEHFNAVWVKNEWSRYLDFMKSDRKRTLIPCYKDMDPYDMPGEFSNLQAQDMGKIGAMQDLIRGILKIVQPAPAVTQTVVMNNTAPVEPLLKRANIFLEDGDWKSVQEYCEKVLDLDPECGEAYLLKVMSEYRKNSIEAFGSMMLDMYKDKGYDEVRGSKDFLKAIKFGSADVKAKLEAIKEKADKKYQVYCLCNSLNKVSDDRIRRDREYEKAIEIASGGTLRSYKMAIDIFNAISPWRDSAELAQKYKARADELTYAKGVECMRRDSLEQYKEAMAQFEQIPDWEDSRQRIEECKHRIEELSKEEQKAELRRDISATKKELQTALADLKKAKSGGTMKWSIIWLVVFLVGIVLIVVGCCLAPNDTSPNRSMSLSLFAPGCISVVVTAFASAIRMFSGVFKALLITYFTLLIAGVIAVFVMLKRDKDKRYELVKDHVNNVNMLKEVLRRQESELEKI